MIRCPQTHEIVFTGRVVNVPDPDHAHIPGSSFRCTRCGQVHHWEPRMTTAVPMTAVRMTPSARGW